MFGWKEISGKDSAMGYSPRQMYWLKQWLHGTSCWTTGRPLTEGLIMYELSLGLDSTPSLIFALARWTS